MERKPIIEFNSQTGLVVSSKPEIFDELVRMTKIAYGQDFVIEQGNSWYSHLDMLSSVLSNNNGVAQVLFNSLSAESASGAVLDNVVSMLGLTRNTNRNATVNVRLTRQDPTNSDIVVFELNQLQLIDVQGNIWTNIDVIYIPAFRLDQFGNTTAFINQNSSGTFESIGQRQEQSTDGGVTWSGTNNPTTGALVRLANIDGTNITLNPWNDGTSDVRGEFGGFIPWGVNANLSDTQSFFYVNDTISNFGTTEESDDQLRRRWAIASFSRSIGTIEGLEYQLLTNGGINYAKVYENNTGSSGIGAVLDPHSIWVVTDGESTWNPGQPDPTTGVVQDNEYSQRPEDVRIANIIMRYKSIGCGTSWSTINAGNQVYGNGVGDILVSTSNGTQLYDIKFSRAKPVVINVNVVFSSTETNQAIIRSIIENTVTNITNYVTRLGIGESVTESGVMGQVYNAIGGRSIMPTDVSSLTITGGSSITGIQGNGGIQVDEYPVMGTITYSHDGGSPQWNI